VAVCVSEAAHGGHLLISLAQDSPVKGWWASSSVITLRGVMAVNGAIFAGRRWADLHDDIRWGSARTRLSPQSSARAAIAGVRQARYSYSRPSRPRKVRSLQPSGRAARPPRANAERMSGLQACDREASLDHRLRNVRSSAMSGSSRSPGSGPLTEHVTDDHRSLWSSRNRIPIRRSLPGSSNPS